MIGTEPIVALGQQEALRLIAQARVGLTRRDAHDNNSHHCAAHLAARRGRGILWTPPIWRKRIGRRSRPDPDYTSGAMANRRAWSRANMTGVRSIGIYFRQSQPYNVIAYRSDLGLHEMIRHLAWAPSV